MGFDAFNAQLVRFGRAVRADFRVVCAETSGEKGEFQIEDAQYPEKTAVFSFWGWESSADGN